MYTNLNEIYLLSVYIMQSVLPCLATDFLIKKKSSHVLDKYRFQQVYQSVLQILLVSQNLGLHNVVTIFLWQNIETLDSAWVAQCLLLFWRIVKIKQRCFLVLKSSFRHYLVNFECPCNTRQTCTWHRTLLCTQLGPLIAAKITMHIK